MEKYMLYCNEGVNNKASYKFSYCKSIIIGVYATKVKAIEIKKEWQEKYKDDNFDSYRIKKC